MTTLHQGHRYGVGRLLVAAVVTTLAVSAAASATAQQADGGKSLKLGILPFTDATASGNHAAGADVGRTMLSEVVHSATLTPRMLVPDGKTPNDAVDGEQAVELARAQHLDLVFMGSVLEAKTQESNKSGWLPSIKGQSANLNIRRVKATVTLQGELYDVASGKRLFSVRVTGNESNNAVGGSAYTTFGSWGNDTYRNFLESPLGKALQTALADMTKKVAATRPSSGA